MSILSNLFNPTADARNLYYGNTFRYLNDDQPIVKEEYFDYINKAYKIAGPVYECVSLIAQKIAQCPRLVYQVKNVSSNKYKEYKNLMQSSDPASRVKALLMKDEVMTEVKVDSIEKLLNSPNAMMNGDDFWELSAVIYLLMGNLFIYGNTGDARSNKWTEIFALPDLFIESGGMNNPVKAYYQFYNTASELMYPADKVKHIKTPNPDYNVMGTQLYGMSPLRSILYEIDAFVNGNKQADKQMKNGGKLGIFAPKNKEDQFAQDQAKQVKQSFVNAFNSSAGYDRLIPMAIAMEFIEIGLTLSDMSVFPVKEDAANSVYRNYHVPLQFRSQDSATYNNLNTANKQFIWNAVAPLCHKLGAAMTEFICTPYKKADGKVYEIVFDYYSLPEMNQDNKELSEWLNRADWLDQNEKRSVMGWGRRDGLDVFLVPKNKAPIEKL